MSRPIIAKVSNLISRLHWLRARMKWVWFVALHESGCGTKLPIWNVRFNGEYRGQSGHHLLVLSFTGFDPERSLAVPKFRIAA